MSAYINGNLAIEQKPAKKAKVQEQKKVVVKRKSIPVQEKLLYLFTVIVCVLVAGAIIWRYAQIYELNTRMQQIESQIKALQIENNKLKLEITKYQDPKKLLDQAKQLGLVPNEVLNQVTDKRGAAGGDSVAMKKE
ncbi:cell division protein FtsL [Paenibacillus hemerocallicola]|uniref:Cell division protein FtsL n=1 Tax=Paenibacillus hemerocallicola TaxID=1172614 RepID=A0A5C4TBN1_9BACL|nr:cell division protein FtsL [Paenibacillus hemerocallicola]TNJ66335.1 cell division protein FtsL [Paenibacillus hemerocallicola]